MVHGKARLGTACSVVQRRAASCSIVQRRAASWSVVHVAPALVRSATAPQHAPEPVARRAGGRALTLIDPSEEAILLERPVEELKLPPAAVRVRDALRAMDVTDPQQLLCELGCLRARLDWRLSRKLALVSRAHQRVHELRSFEVLDALRAMSPGTHPTAIRSVR